MWMIVIIHGKKIKYSLRRLKQFALKEGKLFLCPSEKLDFSLSGAVM